MPPPSLPASIDDTAKLLEQADYVADRRLATALYLALSLERPLFLEGEAGRRQDRDRQGAGRQPLGRRLVRLQCYEGLDVASAVYEWNYQRQMLEIRLAEAAGDADREAITAGHLLRALPDPPAAAAGAGGRPRRRRRCC